MKENNMNVNPRKPPEWVSRIVQLSFTFAMFGLGVLFLALAVWLVGSVGT